ncbi:MAG: hypothetical protein KF850_14625 [Labilithrix sp.]|nr:hypothetical protein [Labilithrix sp.]
MHLRYRRPAPLDAVHGARRGFGAGRTPTTRRASRVAWLTCAAWLALAGPARADKMTDAEELFRRAKTLMADKKDAQACPLLEESQKLDPQMGTLLNLAICHENVGKTASAWGEFRAVEQQARAANREDRVKLARERAAKLEPRLMRIRIVVPPDAKVDGLVVKVDGEPKGEALWSGVAVDPGTRTIEASAPGKQPKTVTVRVSDAGAVVPVTLPPLEDEVVAAPRVVSDPDADRARDDEYAANQSRKSTGIVVGGIGVATMAVGGVFGVLAILNDGDAAKVCPAPCVAGSDAARAADETTDRALLFANVANVALPVGFVVAAIGAYMALSAGPTEKPTARAVTPGRSRAGDLGGRALLSPRPGGAALTVSW